MSDLINGIQSTNVDAQGVQKQSRYEKAKEDGVTVFTFDNNNDGKISTEELDNYLKFLETVPEGEEEIAEDEAVGDEATEDEAVGDEATEDEAVGDEAAEDEAVGDEAENTAPNFDLNGDGELDSAEQLAEIAYNLAQQTPEYDENFDFNKDGQLDFAEKLAQMAYGFIANAVSPKNDSQEDDTTVSDATDEVDTTEDDDINPEVDKASAAEIDEATDGKLENEINLMTFDANNNGTIEQEEYDNYTKYKEAIGDLSEDIDLMVFDTDKNGSINHEEYINYLRYKEAVGTLSEDEKKELENNSPIEGKDFTSVQEAHVKDVLGLDNVPESLKDNLRFDENGSLTLTFDTWDGSKSDNIDCPSRLMQHVYGEYYDWGNEKGCKANKMFEALMELNGVKPNMYANQTITLYSKEDLEAYMNGTKTKEEIVPVNKKI